MSDKLVAMTIKDDQKYVIIYDDNEASESKALDQLSEWALDDELCFSWYDAAAMSQGIRRQRNPE